MPTVRGHRLAELELLHAALYYETEAAGLGKCFLREVERFSRRFPYGFVFVASAAEVRILAVMHLHRRPAYWVERVDSE